MDEKSKQFNSNLVNYLRNQFEGYDNNDYRKAFDNLSKIQQKVKCLQEIEDLYSYAPKFQQFDKLQQERYEQFINEQKKNEGEKIFFEEENNQLGQCYLCLTTKTFKFYELNQDDKEVLICHECARETSPEIICRSNLEQQLLHKRGKVAVHLQTLKQQLKSKKMMKMSEKDRILNEKLRNQIIEDEKALENQAEQKVCQLQECQDKNNQKHILTCKSCERSFHSECLEVPLEFTLVNRFNWFCTDCKLCIICWKSGNEDELLICDCCDRAYHMGCRKPKIIDIPEGKWFCTDCERCASCKKLLLDTLSYSKESLQKYSKQSIDMKLICDDCWVHYEQQNYCPICYKIILEEDEGDYVGCDCCELWIHFECEKIPQHQIEDIQQLQSYTCLRCRNKLKSEQAKKLLEQKLIGNIQQKEQGQIEINQNPQDQNQQIQQPENQAQQESNENKDPTEIIQPNDKLKENINILEQNEIGPK